MQRISNLLLLLAVGAAAFAGLGSARTAQTAQLRLLALNPLTVAGSGFRSREPVRVTATSADRSQTVRLTVTPTGSFRVAFREIAPTRCGLLRVVAVGRSGSTAVLKRPPLPACMPVRLSG
jgi:hypothetical protein